MPHVANHGSTIPAWFSILALALPRGIVQVSLPMTKDTCLCNDPTAITTRASDQLFENLRAGSDVLPMLLGSLAEVNDVCA